MQVGLDSLPLAVVMIAGLFAPIAGWLASTRSRHPLLWFVLGACTGPFAIALLALAPPGRCPACETPVRGWPSVCERCGLTFGGVAGVLDAPPAAGRPFDAEPRSDATRMPGDTPMARPVPVTPALVRPRSSITHLGGVRPEPRPAATSGGSLGVGLEGAARPTLVNPVEQVLATGLYLSGNVGLEIGATYAIARVGPRLRIFGPVDAGDLTARVEGDLDEYEVTALDDRVIISGRPGHSSIAIILRAIGGMRASDLERALGAAGADSGRTA